MNWSDERGQSETLAVAIIFVLALGSALLIAGVASMTLEEGRQVAETQSGIQTMTELDSRASLVALEGGESTTMDVRSRAGGGRVSVDRSGEIRFVMQGPNGTIWRNESTLGTITYANGNRRIAYQGGGVWRRTVGANGSVMVSPPEVHYRQGTLTLPMINITGTERGISTVRITKKSSERIYPIPSRGENRSNPVVEGNQLTLFVKSDYYQGWAQYFRDRIGANVTVLHGDQTVRVDLVAPVSQFAVDSGLISVGTGAPIDMQGTGNNPTFVDSYNSCCGGNYSTTAGRNGTVRSPSGLDQGGETFIKGTVNTGGDIEFAGNNNTIFGDAWHQGIINPQNGRITGQNDSNGSGVEIPPIDATVNQRVNSICSNGTTQLGGGDTVGPGEHCHSGDLTLNGGTLTIDVSNDSVDLAVDGDLTLKSSAAIEVVGTTGNNHTVELWLGGKSVTLTSSEITVPDQESPAFRLFAKSGTDIDLRGQGGGASKFVGLLYAPTTRGAGGSLDMQSDSDLYGAAVTGEVSMQAGSAVHYDQALEGFTFQRSGTPASRLSYLYVTVNEIEIEER